MVMYIVARCGLLHSLPGTMTSELDCHVPTYAVVDMSKKKKHSADKNDDQPEILSDIPATYSKLNREKKLSIHTDATFDNATYSMVTLENMRSNTTADESCQKNPHDNAVEIKSVTCKKNLQKNWRVSCVMVVIIIFLLILVVASIAAFAEISQLKSEISLIHGTSSYNNSLNLVLSQNYSALEKYAFHLGNETDHRLNELEIKVNQTFSAVATTLQRLLGLYHNHPATSCASILQFAPSSPSGHYWITSSNESAVRVYCDMTKSCGNITGGWMRVAELDMRDCYSQCPCDLKVGIACNPIRTCVINSCNASCSSVFFTTHGFNYSRVCGMIRAYQVGIPDAFGNHGEPRLRNSSALDSNYVDGISLTHGSPKQHIWTFAAEGGKI